MNRPIIGFMTYGGWLRVIPTKGAFPTMVMMMEAARELGLQAYAFALEDVDTKRERVFARQMNTHGKWQRAYAPLPDVIYQTTRVFRRNSLAYRRYKFLLGKAQFINSVDIFGKWECYQALSSNFQAMRHLPETVPYKAAADLRRMLRRHKSVLAKPGYGLGGANISRCWRMGRRRYGWQDSTTGRRATNLTFRQLLALVLKNANGPFIVQQELFILSYAGRRHFIRVLVTKNGKGEWEESGSYLILGGKNQFAVNRHRGGEQFVLNEGLAALHLDPAKWPGYHQELSRVALLMADAIERAIGRMGEFGLDLAFDTDGHIWMFEANVKPHKDHLPFPSKAERMRPFYNLMAYARYLYDGG